jgi:hypothetical protein
VHDGNLPGGSAKADETQAQPELEDGNERDAWSLAEFLPTKH